MSEAKAGLDSAIEAVGQLRKALAWYADEENHRTTLIDADSKGMHSPMVADGGARARKALEGAT